jgi:hypothetical protein
MPNPSSNGVRNSRNGRFIWSLALILVTIGLLAAGRRTATDGGFAWHKALTLAHILPASLFMALMPLQFVRRIRERHIGWQHIGWHRWSGGLLVALGLVAGISALALSYTSIGGVNETAATTWFAVLFPIFLGFGFWNIRNLRIAQHREWMIRAFGVALGIATTRPIFRAFFPAGRLSPHEFFGTAFWLGFSLTLLGAEVWIHTSRTYSLRTLEARN